MPLPRMLALDLDGTLLNSAGEISERNIRALARYRAAGGEVVLATGRPTVRALPVARALGGHICSVLVYRRRHGLVARGRRSEPVR